MIQFDSAWDGLNSRSTSLSVLSDDFLAFYDPTEAQEELEEIMSIEQSLQGDR